MQEKIVQELGYKPIEQEVTVVYQGETYEQEIKVVWFIPLAVST